MSDTRLVSAESARTEAMNDLLANNWWAAALRGLLAVTFGVLAFVMPGVTLLSLALVFAAYSLVDGVTAIIMSVRGARKGERWVWLLLSGLLGILAAAITAIWPELTVLAFVYLVAAWALLSGILMLVSAFRLKKDHGRVWLGAAGVASILLSILLAISPLLGALVLTFWIGAHALVSGGFLLVLAYQLHSKRTDSPRHIAPAHAS